MSEPQTYALKKPIETKGPDGSRIVTHLTFREMGWGDWEDFPVDVSKWTMGEFIRLAAKLSGQSPTFMRKLGMPDAMAVQEILGNALALGPVTPESPSESSPFSATGPGAISRRSPQPS